MGIWDAPPDAPQRVLIVFGTRPEAIKIAPVALALRSVPHRFETVLCSTGQHRELVDQALAPFGLSPDIDLRVMRSAQRLADVAGRILAALDRVYAKRRPDLVLVQGDTTSCFVGALAAYYRRIPVAHLEAGLRTDDLYDPFPEEVHRRLVSSLATFHFAPTSRAASQLSREGLPADDILVTGNTVIDALLHIYATTVRHEGAFERTNRRSILVTMHRRESYGAPFENICRAITSLADNHRSVEFVLPVHPAPSVQEPVRRLLGDHPRIRLIGPMPYPDFVATLSRSHFVMTDSGGIQEEAPALAKPVLVLRNTTERPEAVSAGTAKLVGTTTETIVEAAQELLGDSGAYERMARAVNPFGDGHAADRVVDALSYRYGYTRVPPDAFSEPAVQEAIIAR